MTRTITMRLPESVSKRLPMLPEQITVPDLSLPNIKRPHFSRPNMPHLSRPQVSLASLPEEARRPIYATVGAGDLAVERVREAAVAVQERITGAQKSVAEKASALKDDLKDELVTDNMAIVTSRYAGLARRGEQVLGRIWPTETDAPSPAPAKSPAKTAAKTANRPAPKTPTKPTSKRAAKAPATARATGPRAAAQQPTRVAAPRKPKTTRVPKAGSTEPTLKPVPVESGPK